MEVLKLIHRIIVFEDDTHMKSTNIYISQPTNQKHTYG